MRRSRSGFTMVEVIIAAAIGGVILLGVVRFSSKMLPYFKRLFVKQESFFQARSCMDTILQLLRTGKAGTLVISSPVIVNASGTFILPNSKVNFELIAPLKSGTTAYSIYLSTSGTAFIQEFRDPIPRPRALASNVVSLTFTGDSRDSSMVNVSLRMDTAWDTTGDPSHTSTLILANQTVQMSSSH